MTSGEQMAKLMLSIRDESYRVLSVEAQSRGITIQELLRAVIVPDWIRTGVPDRTQLQGRTPAAEPINRRDAEIPPIFSKQWSRKGLSMK